MKIDIARNYISRIISVVFYLLMLIYSQYSYGGIEKMIDMDIFGERYISVDIANVKNITEALGAEINKALLDDKQPIYRIYFNGVSFDRGTLSMILGALQQGAALREINLSSIDFRDEDALAIAAALQQRSTLATLYLWINNIGDLGIQAIFTALGTNTTLTTFELDGGNIGPMGAMAIARTLRINQTITDIAIRSNIGYEELYVIMLAIVENMTLLQIDINCTEDQKKLFDLVSQRNTKIAVLVQKLREFNARWASSFLLGTNARVDERSPTQLPNTTHMLQNTIGGNTLRNNSEFYDMILFGTLEELRRYFIAEDIIQINEIRRLQLQIYEQVGLRIPREIILLETGPLNTNTVETPQIALPQEREERRNTTLVPQQQPIEQQVIVLQDDGIPLIPNSIQSF